MPPALPPTPEFDPRTLQGLSDAEAARRFAAEGPNELPTARPRHILRIAADVLREPMLLLLLGAAAIYLVVGDRTEALILSSFVIVVTTITFLQERKTERAVEALRDLSSPRALVIRGGVERRVAGREVVRGDVIRLVEGDRVPADAVLLEARGLSVDESLLTGESVPVRKRVASPLPEAMGPPGGEASPFVFSGTLVGKGQGYAAVRATGAETAMGRIGKALAEVQAERTPLQREVGRMVRVVALAGVALCVLVTVVYAVTRGDLLRGVLSGITLAMAMLPEEFPVVLTVFLALGTYRIAQRRVLTRRLPVIETIGAATVLAVDKTGTLTQNRMTIRELRGGAGCAERFVVDGEEADRAEMPEAFHALAEYGVLASPIHPFDPMDAAFKALGERFLDGTEHLHPDFRLEREYALSDQLLALSHVWRSPSGGDYVIAAKGAPEAIFDLCHLSEEALAGPKAALGAMTDAGLRVLGVARAVFTATAPLPSAQHDFDFELVGLVGLKDPVRPGVPAAVSECREAGIRVVMITGDYPGTALAIGRECGIVPAEAPASLLLTGGVLASLSDEELAARIEDVRVFARVVPEQKLRIVRALAARGHVVAMTGDGVNDAPALKAADIGVAMGGRGTDVAREAASLVLTDDDFSSIVGAVRAGRRIFDNLKKAMAYILAVHVPIAGMSLLPVLLGMPLMLLPVHIAFLELVIDPACSIVFEAEPEEAGVMRRPPRTRAAPLFGRRLLLMSLLEGAAMLGAVFLTCALSLRAGRDEAAVRALTFTALVVGNVSLIAVNRSLTQTALGGLFRKNRAFGLVVAGTLAFLGAALFVRPLHGLFRFAPLAPVDLLIAVGAGLGSVTPFEVAKLLRRRKRARREVTPAP